MTIRLPVWSVDRTGRVDFSRPIRRLTENSALALPWPSPLPRPPVGTWTKIGLTNTDYNDLGAFDAANNRFVAPVDGTYLFGATLLYKVNASTSARMSCA